MLPLAGNILMQVTHAKAALQSQQIKGHSLQIRKWKFSDIDGDQNSILLWLDSSLNISRNLLCPRAVVKISNAIPD
jgi:hypothetical protein